MNLPPELIHAILQYLTIDEKFICTRAHPIFNVMSMRDVLTCIEDDPEGLYRLADGFYNYWLQFLTENERSQLVENLEPKLDGLYYQSTDLIEAIECSKCRCTCPYGDRCDRLQRSIKEGKLKVEFDCLSYGNQQVGFTELPKLKGFSVEEIQEYYREVSVIYVPRPMVETLCDAYYDSDGSHEWPGLENPRTQICGSCSNSDCKNSYRTLVTWDDMGPSCATMAPYVFPSDMFSRYIDSIGGEIDDSDFGESFCNTDYLIYVCNMCQKKFCELCGTIYGYYGHCFIHHGEAVFFCSACSDQDLNDLEYKTCDVKKCYMFPLV